MKVAYVVQRYGPEIRGGAETHCRAFAEHLAHRGYDVHVYTTCAIDYRTWHNAFPPGTTTEAGVTVHRYKVAEGRSPEFDQASAEILPNPQRVPRDRQEEWMNMQGPRSPELVKALRAESGQFDLVIFVTYLYYTTYFGLPEAGDHAVLHPTAHDEPPIHLPIFDDMFQIPKGFVFLTDEERRLVHRRFDISAAEVVTGTGIEPPTQVDETIARSKLGLTNPYVLYLGRIDPSKGMDHLLAFFSTYRARTQYPVELVLAGDGADKVAEMDGIRMIGALDDEEKWSVLAGAEVLIHPSYYESFAMNLLEAWCVGTPAVVNAHCDVTVGHCRRANAGVWYRSYAEFESCLDHLLADASLRRALGAQGREYVHSLYQWNDVIDRYLHFLESVVAASSAV